MNDKDCYVIVESSRDSDKIKGKYDFYVTPWSSFTGLVEQYAENIPVGEKHHLSITVYYWTREEYAEYCERNDVETCF